MLLKNVRIAFAHIFKPYAMNEGDAKKYSVAILVPKDHPQLPAIKAEMKKVRDEKWGDKKISNLKLCLQDGAEKAEYDGYDDTIMFFNSSNGTRPLVLDKDKTPLVEEDGRPYSGCYCNIDLDFWAQDNKWGKRINSSLAGIQFARDGEPFSGGRKSDADSFDEVVEDDDFLGATGTDDPLA